MPAHHYVSKFHLREFCDPESLSLPDPWLWVGNISDHSVKRRAPKNVGTAPDLFDGPGGFVQAEASVEEFLANNVEGPASRALREVVNRPSSEIKELPRELLRYLAWAASRSLPMQRLEVQWSTRFRTLLNAPQAEPPPEGLVDIADRTRPVSRGRSYSRTISRHAGFLGYAGSLCDRRQRSFSSLATGPSARFITLDPLVRAINGQRDTYYTLVSLARTPTEWPEGNARDTLLRLGELHFGATIGRDRIHHVGANSYDDLFFGGPLPKEHSDLFARTVGERRPVELFHILIFDAIRRLKRFEWALAIMDAQSAFEVLVATVLAEILARQGETRTNIEDLLAQGGRFDSLQRRLVEIDRVAAVEAAAAGEQVRRFLGSPAEATWRADLYRVRHRIVHEGLRQVTFDLAKRGVVAGLKAAHAVQDLRPAFNRQMIWSGPALDLPHITQSAGRLSRLFEA